uniref:Uncharacterized protein n=1 Tax=Calidris pygmaea TaxID=425635 RepID=A0A8C3PJZ9_9CHAR
MKIPEMKLGNPTFLAAGHAEGASVKESRASRAKRRGQGGGGHDALKG